jgi:UDP-N-acetylglucosamine 2-epimerase (non-hydrolysing)/UDP-GlcNAc3NAcA epimerase
MPLPVLFTIHPRTRQRLDQADLLGRLEGSGPVITAPPLGYPETATLLVHARALLTDSGGLQKEAYLAGVPCVTLRSTTEWTETVDHGWNVLVDLDAAAAVSAVQREPPAERPPLYGDGHAGERVVAALRMHVG